MDSLVRRIPHAVTFISDWPHEDTTVELSLSCKDQPINEPDELES